MISISRAKGGWHALMQGIVVAGMAQAGNFVRRGGKLYLLRRNKK